MCCLIPGLFRFSHLRGMRDRGSFNSRSLCGERTPLWQGIGGLLPFQFSLPVRGAYNDCVQSNKYVKVSILAPCAGSVERLVNMKITDLRFNSRSLCGERKVKTMTIGNNIKFQFSLPVRGAYRKLYKERTCSNVSILAPCAGSVRAFWCRFW